jgi:hypothetical protein
LYPLFKFRLLYLALAAGLFFLSFYVGAVVWISTEHADNIRQELGQRLVIFANNLGPSLEMFIPAAGLIIGVYSAVSTGLAFNAFCTGKSCFEINFSTQSVNLSFCSNGNP